MSKTTPAPIKPVVAKPVPIILGVDICSMTNNNNNNNNDINDNINNSDNDSVSSLTSNSYNSEIVADKLDNIFLETQDICEKIHFLQDEVTKHMSVEDASIITAELEAGKREAEQYTDRARDLNNRLGDPMNLSGNSSQIQKDILELDSKAINVWSSTAITVDLLIKNNNPEVLVAENVSEEYENLLNKMHNNISERDALLPERIESINRTHEEINRDSPEERRLLEESYSTSGNTEEADTVMPSIEEAGTTIADTEKTEEQDSKKRKREDSEDQEGESSENKKQKTDHSSPEVKETGSIIDDYADPNLEFPSYTDGDD